jgi:hypothetical protein
MSLFLTFLTYINNHIKDPIIKEFKQKEQNLSFIRLLELYINRFIHYISTIVIMGLPYIFKPELIIYVCYEIYMLVALYSWYILRECPYSIHEKQILDEKYVNGYSRIHPFIALILPNIVFLFGFTIMHAINSIIVGYRLYEHYYLPESKIPEEVRI